MLFCLTRFPLYYSSIFINLVICGFYVHICRGLIEVILQPLICVDKATKLHHSLLWRTIVKRRLLNQKRPVD